MNQHQQTALNQLRNNNGMLNPHGVLTQAEIDTASASMYRLNASLSNARTGLSMTVQVSAGDTLDILGESYYTDTAITGAASQISAASFLQSLTASPGRLNPAKHSPASGILASASTTDEGLLNFLQEERPAAPGKPRAYINYIFFDQDMQFVEGGYSQVGEVGELKQHFEDLQAIAVEKSGYVYIYASNDGNVDVFFDNKQVVHTFGPFREEKRKIFQRKRRFNHI